LKKSREKNNWFLKERGFVWVARYNIRRKIEETFHTMGKRIRGLTKVKTKGKTSPGDGYVRKKGLGLWMVK